MKAYISYRPIYMNNGQGRYTLSYFLDQQYADYVSVGVTSIKDLIIGDERYTKEVVPGVKNLRRFAVLEANGIDINEFRDNIVKIGASFDINTFATTEEARQWIRDNTDLAEETPGNFVLSEEATDIMGQAVPKKYLEVN